jgi:hypothetical protein
MDRFDPVDYEVIEGILDVEYPDLHRRVDFIVDFYRDATLADYPETRLMQMADKKAEQKANKKISKLSADLIIAIGEVYDSKPMFILGPLVQLGSLHDELAKGDGMPGRPRRSIFETVVIKMTAEFYKDATNKKATTDKNAPTKFIELLEEIFRLIGNPKALSTLNDQAYKALR